MKKLLLLALSTTSALYCATAISTELGEVSMVIKTQIDNPDPQPGMKSTQTITIDFQSQSARQNFVTGVTELAGQQLESVRNKFEVRNVSFSGNSATFIASGQTASGVLFMPNINYKFNITLNADSSGIVSGCHDGYPSYIVRVAQKKAYEFKHKPLHLFSLLGECDTEIKTPISF